MAVDVRIIFYFYMISFPVVAALLNCDDNRLATKIPDERLAPSKEARCCSDKIQIHRANSSYDPNRNKLSPGFTVEYKMCFPRL